VNFEQDRISFQEANRRYAELRRQRDAGIIDEEEFDEQLKQLMVLDDENRWWAKSRRTGEWLYHDGTAWVSGEPPLGYQSPQNPSKAPSSPSSSRALWTFAIIGGVILVGVAAAFWWFGVQRASQVTAQQGGEQESQEPQQVKNEGGQVQSQGEQQGVEESTPPQPDDVQNLGVGESVEAGNLRVTLERLRILPRNPGIDMPVQSPDNLFLALHLTFENLSSDQITVRYDQEFTLESEEGSSARQAVHTQQILLDAVLGPGPEGPGNVGEGEIVYEVPPESQGLELFYTPPGGGTYTWYIGDASELPSPTNTGSASASAGSASASPASGQGSVSATAADEAAVDYYRAAGVGDWDYTYEHLDSSTQSLFTREEWFQKNQWLADQGSVIYDILSVETMGDTQEPVVEVSLNLTYEDGSSSTRTTYFVYEDGAWKHRFGQEEYDLFMPDASYEEFVAAQQ
jgi:hypothetical protein